MPSPLNVTTKEYLDVNNGKLGDLILLGRRQFRIPYNQRPWAWKDKDLADLWDDLLATMGGFYKKEKQEWTVMAVPTTYPHFMGAFVFLESEDDGLEVVDGQQRLTAMAMLLSCIRDACKTIEKETKNASLKVDATNMTATITSWLMSDISSGRPRLLADELYKPFFDALVINPSDNDTRNALLNELKTEERSLKEHKLLEKSFHYLHTKVTDELKGMAHEDQYSFLYAAMQCIQSAFFAAWVIIKKEPYAFQVFGCLNTRGEPLSQADMIKNELFALSQKNDHEKIVTSWRNLQQYVPRNDISTFLRRWFISAIDGDCPKSVLFKNVKEKWIDKSQGKMCRVVSEWESDARLLSEVLRGSHAGLTSRAKECLKDIKTLGISLAEIFLLSAGKIFLSTGRNTDFDQAVEICLNYCFRVLTVGKSDTPVLEQDLGEASRILLKTGDLTKVRAYLSSKNSDATFESAFSSHKESRVDVQFYILYQLEKYLSGAAGLIPHPHSPSQHIEHILPKKPSASSARLAEWKWARDDKSLHQELINRLGNLCILESDINAHVSNYSFHAKQNGSYPGVSTKYKGVTRKCYKDSTLKLPRELADTSKWHDWSPGEIEKRQKEMARCALAVWRLL